MVPPEVGHLWAQSLLARTTATFRRRPISPKPLNVASTDPFGDRRHRRLLRRATPGDQANNPCSTITTRHCSRVERNLDDGPLLARRRGTAGDSLGRTSPQQRQGCECNWWASVTPSSIESDECTEHPSKRVPNVHVSRGKSQIRQSPTMSGVFSTKTKTGHRIAFGDSLGVVRFAQGKRVAIQHWTPAICFVTRSLTRSFLVLP